jgi:hypothetical protein
MGHMLNEVRQAEALFCVALPIPSSFLSFLLSKKGLFPSRKTKLNQCNLLTEALSPLRSCHHPACQHWHTFPATR